MAEANRSAQALALRNNINRLCDKRGITHKELAEKSGITNVSISRYCSGARLPSATTLYAMAKALECRMDELLEGVDDFPVLETDQE